MNVRYKDGTTKSAGLAMIEMNTGTFQFLPDATNLTDGIDLALPRIETGGIPLGKPSDRTHVAYVDMDVEVIGAAGQSVYQPGAVIDLTSTGETGQCFLAPYYMVIPESGVDTATSTITTASPHYMSSGFYCNYSAAGGTVITGLLENKYYKAIVTGPTTFQVAEVSTPTVPITLTGTGNDNQVFFPNTSIGTFASCPFYVPPSNVDIVANTVEFVIPTGIVPAVGEMTGMFYDKTGLSGGIDPLADATEYYVVNVVAYGKYTLSTGNTVFTNATLTAGVTNAFDGTIVDGPPTSLTEAGRFTYRCWINQLTGRMPRFRFTLQNTGTAKVRVWGVERIAFDQGGQLP